MYIICSDPSCENRARFCVEVPISSLQEPPYTYAFVCHEHLGGHLRNDEWRHVRTLYIPQEDTNLCKSIN